MFSFLQKAMSALVVNMYCFIVALSFYATFYPIKAEDHDRIDIIDMTRPTTWKDMSEYYGAIEKGWKICVNCGSPSLGTVMHLDHISSAASMHPAIIPTEYLLTRLAIIDVSSHTAKVPDEEYILTLDVALQWPVLKHDPREPTLLLFKFGWKEDSYRKKRSCVCKIPGISYELAEWISTNLTHVVGVGTDAPSLESAHTREFATRTVANLLGRNGVYMIENVIVRRKMPDQGCMVISMPLKLQNSNYVPTRLTAFCPTDKTELQVAIALKKSVVREGANSRIYDVNLDEILN